MFRSLLRKTILIKVPEDQLFYPLSSICVLETKKKLDQLNKVSTHHSKAHVPALNQTR